MARPDEGLKGRREGLEQGLSPGCGVEAWLPARQSGCRRPSSRPL